MIRLILIRHGNTFAPGDPPVWAGARTDLPLVAKGCEQADAMGHLLAATDIAPTRILAGPLLRTRQHAQIIAGLIHHTKPVEISEPLREVDYGLWEGLSTDEIHALGGQIALTAWDERAIWPQAPGWSPSPEIIEDSIQSLLDTLSRGDSGQTILLVTSNGILRFFARACQNPPLTGNLKVRTGHYCIMEHDGNGWKQTRWNQSPERHNDQISNL